MKIFIVSEAGKIADVTLHTSCKSADESALKVTLMRTLMILAKHTALPQGGGRDEYPTSKFYRVMFASQQFLRSLLPAPPSTLTAQKHEGH